jgi:hypothetical protein
MYEVLKLALLRPDRDNARAWHAHNLAIFYKTIIYITPADKTEDYTAVLAKCFCLH